MRRRRGARRGAHPRRGAAELVEQHVQEEALVRVEAPQKSPAKGTRDKRWPGYLSRERGTETDERSETDCAGAPPRLTRVGTAHSRTTRARKRETETNERSERGANSRLQDSLESELRTCEPRSSTENRGARPRAHLKAARRGAQPRELIRERRADELAQELIREQRAEELDHKSSYESSALRSSSKSSSESSALRSSYESSSENRALRSSYESSSKSSPESSSESSALRSPRESSRELIQELA